MRGRPLCKTLDRNYLLLLFVVFAVLLALCAEVAKGFQHDEVVYNNRLEN